MNHEVKNRAKLEYKAKMEINEMGDMADLAIIPEDLDGNFDYIADTKSMSTGAGEEMINARQKFMQMVLSPQVLQLLQQQQQEPDIKAFLMSSYEDLGGKDGSRFFRPITVQSPGGSMGQQGVPGVPPTTPPGISPEQMAGPTNLPQPGGVPAGI
jgi:hypothetical protein